MKTIHVAATAAILSGALALYLTAGTPATSSTHAPGPTLAIDGSGRPILAVREPALSATEAAGKAAYGTFCADCHGDGATGIEGAGPPFLHPIYKPGHHGDQAFLLAPLQGVRAHHWRYGDMPPVEGVGRDDLTAILAYVRALQRENGIH